MSRIPSPPLLSSSRAVRSGFALAAHLFLGLPFLSAQDASPAWLTWRNGDELKGTLLESQGEQILWKAKPFAEPFRLGIHQLEKIRFSSPAKPSPNQSKAPQFRIHLSNGDRLEGSLLEINSDSIVIECAPFVEPLAIQRKSIERILHINSKYLRYSGPDDLSDWTSHGRDRKTTEWFTDLKGAFATHQWSGDLFRKIEFPNAVELRFSAEIPNGSPNLEIGLTRERELGPMLETWDNFLVMTFESRFVPVLEMTEKTKRLDFRLFWNQQNGDLRICEPSGKEIANLKDVIVKRSGKDGLTRGFSILNRNPELKLVALSVQEWDGSEPEIIDLSRPRVSIAGKGHRFGIDRLSLSKGQQNLQIGGENHPLEKIQEFVFHPSKDATQKNPASLTRIAWYGGSTISGNFQQIDGNALSLQPSWCGQPISVKLGNAREIRFPEDKGAPLDGNDSLSGEGFALGGTAKILGEKSGQSLVGWLPPGASAPVPFAENVEATITRGPHPTAEPKMASVIGQGRVFLSNREVLTGSLISITKDTVHFKSRVTGQIEIPVSKVEAVDIGSAGRVLEGFGDSEWEEIEDYEEEVSVTKEKVHLKGGSFGNPSLLLGDRVHFNAEWLKSYGAMTLRFFADGPDASSPSTDIIIAAQGSRLFVGKLKETGAFSFSGDQIPITDSKATLEISAEPEKIEVFVNGKSTLNVAVDPERVSGNGIYFKMGGGWQGWNQTENEIIITEFRVSRSPGSIPRRIIDFGAKEKALTIPRSRRDPLPTHVLVAPNGDLLRGVLEAATSSSIRFTSKEETFDLPYSRISAIVWLQEPDEVQPTEEEAAQPEPSPPTNSSDFLVTHQFTLMDGSRLHLSGKGIENNRFVGESSILGRCELSIENVREMRRGPLRPAQELASAETNSFADWKVMLTPDPVIPGTEEAPASPLIGKPGPPIELTMLDESKFSLEGAKGKVVVLDFWATWCGPCIRAIPDVLRVVDAFPKGQVVLCAVNQGETPPLIKSFLEKRDWQNLPVALDFDMSVGKSYEVSGIPQTVVIGKDGNVSWIHTGYTEEFRQKLFEAVAKELQK